MSARLPIGVATMYRIPDIECKLVRHLSCCLLKLRGPLMIRSLCTVVVLAHLLVSLVHGYAHTELGVGLSAWQNWYVLIVITVAPLAALILIWTRHRRFGLLLLTVSMAGSLFFGVYYHYVFISPDHVSHLPPGDTQGLFRLTASLLVVTEMFGLIVGLLALRRVSRGDGSFFILRAT